MLRNSVVNRALTRATPMLLQGWGGSGHGGWGDDEESSWGGGKSSGGGGGWGSARGGGGGGSGRGSGGGSSRGDSWGGGGGGGGRGSGGDSWGNSGGGSGGGGGWGSSGGGDSWGGGAGGGRGAGGPGGGGRGAWDSGDAGWKGAPTGQRARRVGGQRGGRGGGFGAGPTWGGVQRDQAQGGFGTQQADDMTDAWSTAPGGVQQPVKRLDPLTLTAAEVEIDGIRKLVGQRVRISGLSDETTWHSLKDHLRQVGEVTYCRLYNGGRATVEFLTPDEAARAITELQGSELEGGTIFMREDREDTVLINTRKKLREAREAEQRARKEEELAARRAERAKQQQQQQQPSE